MRPWILLLNQTETVHLLDSDAGHSARVTTLALWDRYLIQCPILPHLMSVSAGRGRSLSSALYE